MSNRGGDDQSDMKRSSFSPLTVNSAPQAVMESDNNFELLCLGALSGFSFLLLSAEGPHGY